MEQYDIVAVLDDKTHYGKVNLEILNIIFFLSFIKFNFS